MEKPTIAIACDHAGFQMKEFIKNYLTQQGYSVTDFGTNSDQSVDYPDFAHKLGNAISNGDCKLGMIFCGSGNGVNMSVNKHAGVRSALCWTTEISALARAHNNANVCAMPARFISTEQATEIANAFLTTEFEGGRHQNRVNKIDL